MTSQRRFLVSAIRPRFALLVASCLLALHAMPASGQVDVWVDPGHCCLKPGAEGFDGPDPPNEADLTFDVGDWLQVKLFSLGYFTYKTVNHPTSFFEPSERGFIANGTIANDDADQGLSQLLISVHMNSVKNNPNVKGTETHHSPNKYFAYDTKTMLNDLLAASYIHPAMMSGVNAKFLGCSQDRHIKNNSTLSILNVAKPPAVLLEVCFISNGCQWNYILQTGTQAVVAQEIAAGASQYLNAVSAGVDVAALARERAPESELWSPPTIPSRVGSRSSLVSLQEGFEGVTFPPTGWTTQTAGLPVPHAWHRTTDLDDIGSGIGAAFVGSKSASAINEWLISPVVAVAAPDDAIKFSWSGSKQWTSVLDASLSIRQSGTTTWTQLWSLAANEPAADPFIYRERVVDVSGWGGMSVEFGFRVVGSNGASFALDDIAVGDFVPTATAPNDVCASATSLSGVFSVQGVTCYAANDLDPYVPPPAESCVADHLSGPDVFFEVAAAWGDTLHASITSDWGAGLYLVDDCLAPICVAGGYPEDARTSAEIHHRFAPGGTYYLVVDGLQGSCGPFELNGEIVPSPTDVGGEGAVPALRLAAHPNPADGPVTLFGTFAPSRETPVSVEVYNVEGKRLRRVEGRADAGEFSFTWDHRDQSGTRVASGMYFARLRVGNESVVQKFVILR